MLNIGLSFINGIDILFLYNDIYSLLVVNTFYI